LITPGNPGEVALFNQITELPAEGLPPGSWGLHFPLAALVGRELGPNAPQQLVLVLVPQGNVMVILLGSTAQAMWQRYSSNTAPGVPAERMVSPAGGIAFGLLPAGIHLLLSQFMPPDRMQEFAVLTAGADGGRTPFVFRVQSSQQAGATPTYTLGAEFDVPESMLRAFVQASMAARSRRDQPASASPELPPGPPPPAMPPGPPPPAAP
jgi:hypothetical protein